MSNIASSNKLFAVSLYTPDQECRNHEAIQTFDSKEDMFEAIANHIYENTNGCDRDNYQDLLNTFQYEKVISMYLSRESGHGEDCFELISGYINLKPSSEELYLYMYNDS